MDIVGSIILAVTQSILFYGKEIGISMLLFEVICNAIVYYILYTKNKIVNKTGFLLMIPIILLSSTYFIFANTTFYFVNIFVILALNLIMYVVLTNEKNYLIDYLYKAIYLLKDTVVDYKEGIKLSKNKIKEKVIKNENINKCNIKRVAISLIIIFVVVGIVLILLSSADMIFANLFSGILKTFKKINAGAVFNIIIRIICITIMYFAFLILFLKLQQKSEYKEKSIKDVNDNFKFTIKLILIILNIVYLVFCFIQIQTLFGKIDVYGSFNYAKYARSGFFQLMFVSFINFGLILISNKHNDKVMKILNLLLILFTIIIALSAMFRMYMYEMEYGLTYLRIFVYVILATEIISFIPVTIYIFNKNMDLMKSFFIIGLVSYCIVNCVSIEKIIVYKNINRETNHLTDYEYIYNIASEDSFEVLEEGLKDKNEEEKLSILKVLLNIANKSKKLSWQEFNIQKYKIRNKINIENLNNEIENVNKIIKDKEKINQALSKKQIYKENISENEKYIVNEVDSVTGTSVWQIMKATDNLETYQVMNNRLTVSSPSKIKFFENGLGFLERPNGIYCEKSDLLITCNSGKTFEKIKFPDGVFTLSDPKRKRLG